MNEYTPTTDAVRGAYLFEAQRHEYVGNANARAEFDRWYDREKAKWQAEALRDAATNARLCWTNTTNLRSQDDSEVAYSFDVWLDKEADRIERGE